MTTVAVLGAGRMGSAIVRRLATTGHDVVVWNRTAAAAESLAAESAAVNAASSPAAAVAGADVVLSMLATGDITCAVALDETFLDALPDLAVLVDLGTSGLEAAHRLAQGFGNAGRRYLDAPVSGSVPAVQAGTLLIMASGPIEHLDKVRPVLSALARNVLHLGQAGNGQAMKLAVNLVLHSLNSALSESLALAERLGIPSDIAYDVLEGSAVGAPFVTYKRSAFLDPNAPVAMNLALVAKDLGLITAAGRDAGLSLTTTQAVHSQVTAACAAGLGSADMAALRQFLSDSASH
ncbi:NAD(P)-dependent oxidoreductase [soil metagenome]